MNALSEASAADVEPSGERGGFVRSAGVRSQRAKMPTTNPDCVNETSERAVGRARPETLCGTT
jgi:hypothetical protein